MSPRRKGPPRLTSQLLSGHTMARARRLAQLEEAERAEQAAKLSELAQRDADAARDAARRRAEPQKPRKWKLSAETRAKMSAAQRGRRHSAQTRAKIGRAQLGRRFSAEHRANLSRALKGRKLPAETRAKIAQAQRGRRHSAKTRAKISRALRGRPFSAEHRARLSRKVSLAQRGEANHRYWHGAFVSPAQPVKSVEDVIEHLALKQARLSALLDQYLETDPFSPRVVTLFSLCSQGAGKLAQLIRYQESQTHPSQDDITQAIHQALDELREEKGWDV